MNPVVLCALLVSALSTNLPPADQLQSEVLARFPVDPLVITGEVKLPRTAESGRESISLEMHIQWGRNPAVARYHISRSDGTDLRQFMIMRWADGEKKFSYNEGVPPKPAPLPDLSSSILNTGISWADLSLMFLWWPDGKTVGEEQVKGRDCYVIDVPAPLDEQTSYARVVMWLDKEFKMLLRAEGYNADGELVRRLSIKSFKKIDERWMIKDVDVENIETETKARIRIRDVEAVGVRPKDSGTD